MSAKDIPFEECVRQAAPYILGGHEVFQKFTCAQCGARNTMETPNLFYKTGRCQDCDHVTEISACGYMLHMRLGA